jgi:uncharacterized membrane protein YdcZ (DUF606 family)
MALIGSILQEIVGAVAGESVGALSERPVARLASTIRRRNTLAGVLLAWVVGVAAMVFGWRLGARFSSTLAGLIAALLWIGGPLGAIVLTGLWVHRRDP